jgi:hypothetical protein
VKILAGGRGDVFSTADMASAYVDLVTSSLDADTIDQPDIKYIVKHIGLEDFGAAEGRYLFIEEIEKRTVYHLTKHPRFPLRQKQENRKSDRIMPVTPLLSFFFDRLE